MGKAPWLLPALLVVLLLAGWLSLFPIATPTPPDGAESGFSVDRAMETVTRLAASPRVTGTEDHERAGAELEERLVALSPRLEVERQEVNHSIQADGGVHHVIRVRNILARLPGAGSVDGSLLLVGHYDSVAGSPGAADNAAAVASLLETLRQLTAGPPPQRDVVVLFSDSEEHGLAGARAFTEEHPWADDVAMVLNFEARGTQGPSLMFETGLASGPLVDLYAVVAPSPVANSISEWVYSLLPNDTDFSVFQQAGKPGLNFAFIDGAGAYHSAADTPERLSRASLHHQGSTALALTRALADGRTLATGPPRVFFNLPGLGLVVYPRSWVLPLVLVTVALGILLLVLVARRGCVKGGQRTAPSPLRAVLGGLFFLPALLTVVLVLVFVLERLLSGGLGLGPRLLLDNPLWYTGWAAVTTGLALVGLLVWAGRFGHRATALAGLAWWLALTLVAGLALPSAAHLFLWPALFAAVALGVVLAISAGRLQSTAGMAAMLLTSAIWCLLWVPVAALMITALGPRSVTVLAMVAVFATALLAPILLATLAGDPAAASSRRRWVMPGLLVLAGLVLAGVGGGTAGFSSDLPQPTSVYYLLDTDAAEAWWMTLDTPPEPWTSEFVPADHGERSFPRFFEGASQELASAPAPVLPMESPQVRIVSDQLGDEGRRLELVLSSRRQAWRLAAAVRSEAPLTRLEVDGQPLPVLREVREEVTVAGGALRARFRFDSQPPGGYRIVLVQETPAPLLLDLTDWRQELPPTAAGEGPWLATPEGLDPRLRSGTFRRLELPASGAATLPRTTDLEVDTDTGNDSVDRDETSEG